jgi:glycosyltransferase involved in cell wall biosynthesis
MYLKKLIFHFISLVVAILAFLFIPCFVVFYRLFSRRREHPRLVWGAVPIISNKYWSNALIKSGFFSRTMMFSYQSSMNKSEDFDIDIYKLVSLRPRFVQNIYEYFLAPYVAFLYAILNFDIFHHSFAGGFLGATPLWSLEAGYLRTAGKKLVIIPIGFDVYLCSQILDASLRHVLMAYRPRIVQREQQTRLRIDYWTRYADVIFVGTQIDGIGRWDVLAYNLITIDTALWQAKERYSSADGRNGAVHVLHSPNARSYKGTEFVINAVETLNAEGLDVRLILLEGKPNDEVRRVMLDEADILAEQFIAPSYALNGIEGMASGLPVMANLSNESYNRLFRRYSYLNECPVLSTSPETLKENLRLLVTHPRLREELARAGREYVEKYHSERTAQYVFASIYDKIWYGKDVDLLNLFHPLLSEYNRRQPLVRHPLIENKLPASRYVNVQTVVS